MDMISLSTAAIVVFIMSHRLEALSRKPMRTSLSSGLSCGILLLTIASVLSVVFGEPIF
jgi:uncharacterized membrane protein (DUF441 family)